MREENQKIRDDLNQYLYPINNNDPLIFSTTIRTFSAPLIFTTLTTTISITVTSFEQHLKNDNLIENSFFFFLSTITTS